MWYWIISGALVAVVFPAGSFLDASYVQMIVVMLLIALAAVAIKLYQRHKAEKASRAIEKQILSQAKHTSTKESPEHKAEIAALRAQIKRGINALKQSKLGSSFGTKALYALPWYIVVGLPGSGKTAAVRNSGLAFPYVDPATGGGMRGIGATKNCDWWFADEAIILDTAGRYAASPDDLDEWFTFLDSLKKYRSRKPINGVVVTMSLADISESNDESINVAAKQMRARIDEIMARLRMVVPVYVVFTKADRIAGFVEFWSDLRRGERGQVWGFTLPWSRTRRPNPALVFDTEFDLLVSTLHARALRRVGIEANLEIKERVFQFPLEFSALRSALERFVGVLFHENRFQMTPDLRGVYFTSATQEGVPIDRVVAGMMRTFGLSPRPELPQPETGSKSYFLSDLFRKVVFPDRYLAAWSVREQRRQMVLRVIVATVALALAGALVIPATISWNNNRHLAQYASMLAEGVDGLDWRTQFPIGDKVRQLEPLHQELMQLDAWHTGSPPWNMRWGMYIGEVLHAPLRDLYATHMNIGLAHPVRVALEGRIRLAASRQIGPGEPFNLLYDDLRLYIMCGETSHLDPEWAAPRITSIWESATHNANKNDHDILASNAHYYLELMKRGNISPWTLDDALIAKARSAIENVPQLTRLYESLVRNANDLAPIRVDNVFFGSIAPFITSKTGVIIPGAYTQNGWQLVRKLLGSENNLLLSEAWVFGQDDSEVNPDLLRLMSTLRELYFERYKMAWHDFILDLQFEKPANTDIALDMLNALNEPEWPYLCLIRKIQDNTILQLSARDKLQAAAEGFVERAASKIKAKFGHDSDDAGAAGGQVITPLQQAFEPIVNFGTPSGPPTQGSLPKPTGLAEYQGIVTKLIGILSGLGESGSVPNTKALGEEFSQSFRAISVLLADKDPFTRQLLQPLLYTPLTLAWGTVTQDAGGAVGGIWEATVWQKWQQTLDGRYPFTEAPKDAAIADFADFFRPDSGVLWSFYDQYLSSSLEKTSDSVVATKRFKSGVSYRESFLTFMTRSIAIDDSMFAPKGETPLVQFDVNLHSVSPIISEVTIEVDGVSKTYKNGPEEWTPLDWPAKNAKRHGASIQIRGADGLQEEVARGGDFGLFRLLDVAEVKEVAGSDGTFGRPAMRVTWRFKTPGASVSLDLRPTHSVNPFGHGFFAGLHPPRLITEADDE